jgi:hypothetical protein
MPPFAGFPLSISGARIPGAVLRLQSKNGNVICDPTIGADGVSAQYVHEQPVAAARWLVNHNMGIFPSIRAYSIGGREMLAEIVHTSANQAYIYFDDPTAGFAVCS